MADEGFQPQVDAYKTQVDKLQREIRRLKKVEQETIKKDQIIDSLKQELAYSIKKREQYKKQRPDHLHMLKKDPTARCVIHLVTKSQDESGKMILNATTQVFRPVDAKGNPTPSIPSKKTKKRKRKEKTPHQRPVDQIEQEAKFAGLLGKELRNALVVPHHVQTPDGGIVGIAAYQQTMVSDHSPLHHLIHAMGTGEQAHSDTTRAFLDKNAYEQRAEMKAYNAMCSIVGAISDQQNTPLTTLLTNIMEIYKGQVAKRVHNVFTRIGLAKQAKQLSASALKQLEIDSCIIMEDPELFSVFRLITDNVGFTDTVGSYKEYSMRAISSFSPGQLVEWWGEELYLQLAEEYKPVEQTKFLQQYPTPQTLAKPHNGDYRVQSLAEKARIIAAIQMYGRMLQINSTAFIDLEKGTADKETLEQITGPYQVISIPTAYAAGVEGVEDECSVSLPPEAHQRRTTSKSNIPLGRFNNLRSLDVIKEQVSSTDGVRRTMQALECEARLSTYDLRKQYEPKDADGGLVRRSMEELQRQYNDGMVERSGGGGDGGMENSSSGSGSSSGTGSGSGSGGGSGGGSGSGSGSGSGDGGSYRGGSDGGGSDGGGSTGRKRKRKKKRNKKKQKEKSKRKKKEKKKDVFIEELVHAVREAARSIGGRALYVSDNSPAMIMAKLRDVNATGIIADMYSGGFHMLKKVLVSVGLLFDDFVNDIIDPLRLTAAFKTYYAIGSDPRQRWTEEPQLAIGHTAAMVHGYQQYLDAKAADEDVPARKVDVKNPGEWKKVYDYVKELIEEHGRISLVPMLFWLRSCDLASMLRSCGKALPSGDFELYRRLIRLCRILFALTNSMKYIRVNFDLQIFLETCNKIDYLIAKEIGFTGRTATDKPQFMDELQEKLVQIIRILSGGGAGGKKMSPMVKTDMRPRVRNWENVLHQMRTVLHELGVEEDASSVCDQFDAMADQLLVEPAAEQYEGQFEDDANQKLDEKNVEEDKWRNKSIGPFVLMAAQWAVQHGLYNPDPSRFVDKQGKVIPPHTLVSIVSGKSMSLDHLALPMIGLEKLTTYCTNNYGDWTSLEEQNRRKTTRKRRRIDQDTDTAVDVVEQTIIHGPVVTLGRFIGKAIREGDTKEFKGVALQEKETTAIDQVYEQRKTTKDTNAILNKKTIGNTGMRLFENKEELIKEINRVIGDWGKKKRKKKKVKKKKTKEEEEEEHYEDEIQECVLKKLSDGDRTIPLNTHLSRSILAGMIVALREKGVPISIFLENSCRPSHVKMNDSNKFYYSSLDGSKVTKQFKPMQQDFLRNVLCSCNDADCMCDAVVSKVQLCPPAMEQSVGVHEEEEVSVVVPNVPTATATMADVLDLLG